MCRVLIINDRKYVYRFLNLTSCVNAMRAHYIFSLVDNNICSEGARP